MKNIKGSASGNTKTWMLTGGDCYLHCIRFDNHVCETMRWGYLSSSLLTTNEFAVHVITIGWVAPLSFFQNGGKAPGAFRKASKGLKRNTVFGAIKVWILLLWIMEQNTNEHCGPYWERGGAASVCSSAPGMSSINIKKNRDIGFYFSFGFF